MKRTIFSLSLLTLGLSFFSPMLWAQETETEPPAAPAVEAPAETPDASVNPLLDKLRGSGKTGIALFIISVIGFSFAFERVFHLRKSLITPSGLAAKADERWQAGDVDGARKMLDEDAEEERKKK